MGIQLSFNFSSKVQVKYLLLTVDSRVQPQFSIPICFEHKKYLEQCSRDRFKKWLNQIVVAFN